MQTGKYRCSEQIEQHLKMMQTGWFPQDEATYHAGKFSTYPGSPHLAMKIDGCEIDFHKIADATRQLTEKYEVALLKVRGGLTVMI